MEKESTHQTRLPSDLVPFHQFVTKIYTLCNLNCDYCYVYKHADQSWRLKPQQMSKKVVRQLAFRLSEHARDFHLHDVDIVLHGGEPMLAGADFIDFFASEIKHQLKGIAPVRFGMQSNGTVLDESLLKTLHRHNISVGISIDGEPHINDLHRLDFAGRSSHAKVARTINILSGSGLLSGFLCTISLESDPIATYEHLASFDTPGFDFLLPLGHYEKPPPGKEGAFSDTPYADWLIAVFDRWYSERPSRFRIRFFEDIMDILLGGHGVVESRGIDPVDIIVVEADGSLEGVDTLKVVADGAPALGLNLFQHAFADAMSAPSVQARQMGLEGLCTLCQQCPLSNVCGAGYYPERFSEMNGFNNPSIYCADYYKLIRYVRDRIIKDLGPMGRHLSTSSIPERPASVLAGDALPFVADKV